MPLGMGRLIEITGSVVRQFNHLLWRLDRALRQRTSSKFVDAYVAGIAARVPVLYLVLLFDVAILTCSYRTVAPNWVLCLGAVLALIAGVRGQAWRAHRITVQPLEAKRCALARMQTIGGLFALAFMVWTMVLMRYGTFEQRMLVEYVLAVTAFAAMVALAQAPRTALNVALAFSVPALGMFLAARTFDALLLALVQIVFTATMLIAIVTSHREFVQRELANQRLARKLAHTARESLVNYDRATIDDLTGVLNRRAILQRLRDEVARASATPLWLALVDLDGFKHVNDTYGHAAGDAVLKGLAGICRKSLRETDLLGRMGGEEFAIVMGDTDLDVARGVCERLRIKMGEAIVAFDGVEIRFTVSIGLAAAEERDKTFAELLRRADLALYHAKNNGRNRVSVDVAPPHLIASQN